MVAGHNVKNENAKFWHFPAGGTPPLRGGGAAAGGPPGPPGRDRWIRLCQVRLRHAASVLGIIDGFGVACCRISSCCELAYEAGMPEVQLFWVPWRSMLFPWAPRTPPPALDPGRAISEPGFSILCTICALGDPPRRRGLLGFTRTVPRDAPAQLICVSQPKQTSPG